MFIGEVIGNAWGTRKHPSLEGKRLMLVRPIDPMTGAAKGDAVMALDGGVGSGPGSVVLVLTRAVRRGASWATSWPRCGP